MIINNLICKIRLGDIITWTQKTVIYEGLPKFLSHDDIKGIIYLSAMYAVTINYNARDAESESGSIRATVSGSDPEELEQRLSKFRNSLVDMGYLPE
jgi:hypothetical protein